MRIVSERKLGKEVVHYVAPHTKDLRYLMSNFYDYVNKETAKTREDKIIHAFISHLVFVLIHPLDDGNGRIARIINDNLLAKSRIFNHGYYSVSTGIFLTRKDYYAILEEVCTQQHNNITKWVRYGVFCLEKGIDLLLKQIALIAVKTSIFDRFARDLNKREVQLIQSLLKKHLRNLKGKSTSLTLKTKQQNRDKDILHLEELGILKQILNASLKNLKFELNFNIGKTSYLQRLEQKEQNKRGDYEGYSK
ncbi:Fic family protein [Helicobacter suis]|uniref:Fic family protein n=1 Tax=Helicobacter suis TaxID=104628 RepID=UPI0013CF5915|nr:Fic family protein [Helicobacter suis]